MSYLDQDLSNATERPQRPPELSSRHLCRGLVWRARVETSRHARQSGGHFVASQIGSTTLLVETWYTEGRWERDAIEAAVLGMRMPWSVFGPEGPLDPPVSTDSVASFEQRQGVTLPEEYRSFLTQVTGGEVLWLLGFDRGGIEPEWGFWSDFERKNDLYRRPFQFSEAADMSSDGESGLSGTWFLADGGCAMGSMLVISGRSAGEVWTFDNGVLAPCQDESGGRLRFSSWFSVETQRTLARCVRD